MNYARTEPPTGEPVTLEQAFTHLRLDGYGESPAHPEEQYVAELITAAREWAEDYTGRCLAPGPWALQLDHFPLQGFISLPISPVQTVLSVEYVDEDGAPQTVAPSAYTVFYPKDDPQILPAYGTLWPRSRVYPGSVTVTFEAGYTDEQSPNLTPLPERVRRAILLMVAHLYENREPVVVGVPVASVPMSAEYLLHPLRRAIL